MKYEPRQCVICGKEYVPKRKNQVTCKDPECCAARRKITSRAWHNAHIDRQYEARRKFQEEQKRRKPKPDTIVAIGYADRQREETLKMAGKVRTEL